MARWSWSSQEISNCKLVGRLEDAECGNGLGSDVPALDLDHAVSDVRVDDSERPLHWSPDMVSSFFCNDK